ncbi:GtrA family protein [Dyella jiangningensis]|uniref:GtrA family protein n=1 Tax=Dyella jiangningensis TaxID=1379159 RepID=UPI00240F2080|nr:GtrA family protein [Dyella jiangningensis]MDG2539379.1 GtrA family protein [Dyella jiangningensis]
MTVSTKHLSKQLVLYIAFGVLQLAIDWMLFLVFVRSGLQVPIANVMSRFSAAVCGYLLNGYMTFASEGKFQPGVSNFSKFATLWLCLTFCSTTLVSLSAAAFGTRFLPVSKFVIEALIAGCSFVAMKFWVYRLKR